MELFRSRQGHLERFGSFLVLLALNSKDILVLRGLERVLMSKYTRIAKGYKLPKVSKPDSGRKVVTPYPADGERHTKTAGMHGSGGYKHYKKYVPTKIKAPKEGWF